MITQLEIDRALSQIPYPGEDQALVNGYLRSADLADRVIDQTRSLRIRSRRHLMWTVFTVLILIVVVALGLSPTFQDAVSSESPGVTTMVYLMLGAILTTGFVGWVLTLDPLRVEQVLSHQETEDKE
jgi:hypothetical protein